MAARVRNTQGRVGRRHLGATAAAFLMTPLAVSAQQTEQTPRNVAAHASAANRPLPIFYDAALVAKGFPSPLVKARIAGHEALFIIDSGASVTVVADWYARLAKIPIATAAGAATGSGGKTATVRTTHRLQGHWSDGQGFTLTEAIVVAFPPCLRRCILADWCHRSSWHPLAPPRRWILRLHRSGSCHLRVPYQICICRTRSRFRNRYAATPTHNL